MCVQPAPERPDRALEAAALPAGRRADIAERELDSITRQRSGGRRRGDLGTMREVITAWSSDRSTRERGVDWRVKIDATGCRLKAIYPKINP